MGDEFTDHVTNMHSSNEKDSVKCPICGKPIERSDEFVVCGVCGVKMHKHCVDEELLTDAEGNYLCPFDAALAALDWLDELVSVYISALTREQRSELAGRLSNIVKVLQD